ncbi:MAG: PDZ domain-containing protein [Akkermansiaceae bacterium]|nr:PDZ domain-containing protein [Akkermansiaceae bacterium]NNM29112.1 PDZ domain-containing protein [Akkermansiaceae bacterium]
MKPLILAASLLLGTLFAHAGYLGLGFEMTRQGAVVRDLVADGPAAKAGLKDGDIILEIDGKKTRKADMPDIVRRILKAPDGTALKVTFQRDDKRQNSEIILGKRPAVSKPSVGPEKAPVEVDPPHKLLNQRLPEFTLSDWHQLPPGKGTLHRNDLSGKVVALFVFSAGDPEVISSELGVFRTVAQGTLGNDDALAIALHLPAKGQGAVTAKDGIRLLRKHDLHFVPMAHIAPGSDEAAHIREVLKIAEGPYLFMVNPKGVVRLAETAPHPVVSLFTLQHLGVPDAAPSPPQR